MSPCCFQWTWWWRDRSSSPLFCVAVNARNGLKVFRRRWICIIVSSNSKSFGQSDWAVFSFISPRTSEPSWAELSRKRQFSSWRFSSRKNPRSMAHIAFRARKTLFRHQHHSSGQCICHQINEELLVCSLWRLRVIELGAKWNFLCRFCLDGRVFKGYSYDALVWFIANRGWPITFEWGIWEGYGKINCGIIVQLVLLWSVAWLQHFVDATSSE